MKESMIVVCASCGTPGKVVIDTDTDDVVERYFVCRCPRHPLVQRPLTTDESDEPVEMGS